MGFKYTYNYGAAFCTAASSWDFTKPAFETLEGSHFWHPKWLIYSGCSTGAESLDSTHGNVDSKPWINTYHIMYIYIYITIHTLHIFMAIYISLMETDLSSLSRILSYIYIYIDMLTHTHQGLPFFLLHWLFHCEVNHLLYICYFVLFFFFFCR